MNDRVPTEQLLEPLRIALKLEHEGRQFFLEAAEKTNSDLARQTFEFLAKEEDKHIEKIERFYQSLELEGDSDQLPEVEESTAEDRLAEFNNKLSQIRETYKSTDSDIEAYKMALEFENGAEDFYEQKMLESSNPRIKKMYQWLIDEEKMHGRLLKSCLLFAEDPAEWFKTRK